MTEKTDTERTCWSCAHEGNMERPNPCDTCDWEKGLTNWTPRLPCPGDCEAATKLREERDGLLGRLHAIIGLADGDLGPPTDEWTLDDPAEAVSVLIAKNDSLVSLATKAERERDASIARAGKAEAERDAAIARAEVAEVHEREYRALMGDREKERDAAIAAKEKAEAEAVDAKMLADLANDTIADLRAEIARDAAIARAGKAEAEVDRLRADAAVLVHAYDHDSRPPQDVLERLRGAAARVRRDAESGGGEEGSGR